MKYPYIGKSTSNETVVLFSSEGVGVQLNHEIYKHSESWLENNFTNITREYLANTYGEVKSKEHADFIVKLAEAAGFAVDMCHLEGRKFFCFYGDVLLFSEQYDSNKRKIHIPLPPKEHEEDSMKQPERKLLASILTLEQLGYTYHGGELWKPPMAESIKEPEPKEWPQVGDEVLTASKQKAKLIATHDYHAWVKYYEEDNTFSLGTVAIATLTKPPTPEEELREKLKEELSLYISLHDPHDTKIDLTDAILNGEIKNLIYKPE